MCIPYMSYVIGRSIYHGSVIQYWRSCTPSRSIGLYFWGVRGSWAVCHFLFSLVQGLDLLWEYRIQHGANGPLDVTSSYSTWIFCRGVSGFATDCPCDVWYRGLTTCLLHVGAPFGNRILNNSWAVGLTWWIINLIFLCFDICNDICLDTSKLGFEFCEYLWENSPRYHDTALYCSQWLHRFTGKS